MKRILVIFCLIYVISVPAKVKDMDIFNLDTLVTGAPVPDEIENVELLGINKEPYHATLMPYANTREAITAKRHSSTYCKILNGSWKFNWVEWPQLRPVDFYKTDYDVSGWKDIQVPSNWQVLGYGTPYYSNYHYIFKSDFPKIMSEPPKNFTAYKERNPVGSYRRNFNVPEDWKGRRLFLTFDGVDAGFFLWINGKKVGYSVNSRNAAEFDVTNFVTPGSNMIAVEVYRFTSGSYMEDQDMWRLSGIFRNVTLWCAPQEHIRDFFVKTNLDSDYKNAELQIQAKVKNYGDKTTGIKQLSVTLYDKENSIAVSPDVIVPALKPGEETALEISIPVKNPVKWTAETPYLYTTVISLKEDGKNSEIVSSKTGFRKIEIKGRSFLVNGVPIKLKGVNRHEHWPEVGHAITEAQMIKDLEVIKQANCNHIRTCHYSDDPRWYELCDEYGIYLVAEANVECHGLEKKYVEDPRIKGAIIDRNTANVENFKNHPSVTIWSLGNENGDRNINFFAALSAIKIIDSTRPVQYEPFGIDKGNPADIDSRMYTHIDAVEKIALDDTAYTKPFYLCEYAHAMFNSMGAIDEYNELFDKYPTILGGAVWEFQDQGLWNRRDPKHPILAFGGGFGEYPNDHYFIHKGVVASDRSPKPHYPEMKHAYQWIGISARDLAKGEIKIRNRYQFTNLNKFSGSWSVEENGKEILKGDISLPSIAPFDEQVITLPYKIDNIKPGAEYYLRVSFALTEDELWAAKGYEIAHQQFKLPYSAPESKADDKSIQPVTFSQSEREITVKGEGFSLAFDKSAGTFTEIAKNGVNLLAENGGPRLHLWRAPHQIDDMWAYKDWEDAGLKELKWTASDIQVAQTSATSVTVSAALKGEGKNGFAVTHNVTYTILGNGTVKVKNVVNSTKPELVVARIGVRMFLNSQFDRFSYFGRGPMENYSDRKRAFDVSLYKSLVKDQLTPYEKPMECGNHEDVRWAEIKNQSGYGLLVKSDLTPLQVSALPYSDEELEKPEYRIDLPASAKTVMCVSHATLGVGSYGCGPKPLDQYIVYAKPTGFNYEIQIISGN